MDDILTRLEDAARSRYALACEYQADLRSDGTASADELAEAADYVRETGCSVSAEDREQIVRTYATLAALDCGASLR